MPELPEVETIRRSLQDVVGSTINAAEFSPVAPIKHTSVDTLRTQLTNARIETIGRRGKYLLFSLSRDATLIVHLGMSGRLRRAGPETVAPRHTHMALTLSNDTILRYVDPRRFGVISLAASGQAHPLLHNIGPEFDATDFTVDAFLQQCRRHPKLSLKMALLHQGVVAGLGNIYVCEVLYEARLAPTRTIGDTSDDALARVFAAIRAVLSRAITHGGTSLRDYEDSWGNKGNMKSQLQVYGREGQSTLDGTAEVVRIVQHGRSTWYAPAVQQ